MHPQPNNYMQFAPAAPDTASGRAADAKALGFIGEVNVVDRSPNVFRE